MKKDLMDFCQYILDQWELDAADIQDKAEQLIKKWSRSHGSYSNTTNNTNHNRGNAIIN